MADKHTAFPTGLLKGLLVGGLVVGAMIVGAGPAAAQTCMEDVVELLDGTNAVPLNCTANDVTQGLYFRVAGPTSCVAGDEITVELRAEVVAGAKDRYDIGLYVAKDGGDALRGTCHQDYLPPPLALPGSVNPDGGPYLDDETGGPGVGDECGDLRQNVVNQRYLPPITVLCTDTNQDGQADLGSCVSWNNQRNSSPICTTQAGTRPNTKSKCRCTSVGIAGITVRGRIIVDKVTLDADGTPLPGDPTEFTFSRSWSGTFTLTDADDPFESVGLLAGNYSVTETVPAGWALDSATCTGDDSTPEDTSDDRTINPSSIDLRSGELVFCTFTNKRTLVAPELLVLKDNDANGDLTFSDTETYPGTTSGDFPATIDYQVTITNNSASDGSITTITDDVHQTEMEATLLCTRTDTTTFTYSDLPVPIAAGETITCTFDGSFANADIDPVTNTFEVTASNDAGSDIDSDTSTVDFTPAPSVLLDKVFDSNADEDGSGDVSVGDTLTYSFTVTNDGNQTLSSVTISDPLVGAISSCGNIQPGDSVAFVNGTSSLAVGESATCTATYQVQAADVTAGQIDNTATATGTPPGGPPNVEDQDSETVPVPTPSLAIDKVLTSNADEDGSGDVSVGDTLTYTITATNDGTARLTNVVVSDSLITPTGGTTPCALVVPGGTCTLIGTYVVQPSDLGTTITNTGSADSDQTDPVTDIEEVPVPTPSLAIDKSGTLDLGADNIANPGDLITYIFTVTNTGTANLTNVTVTDPLPGLSAIVCGAGDGDDDGDNVIELLNSGSAAVDCTATYAITQTDIDAGQVDNEATADSDQTDPVSDPETVPIPQDPSITLTKLFAADFVIAGGTGSSFTLVATNNGNVTLSDGLVVDTVEDELTVTGVTVEAPVPAGGVDCSASAGQSVSCSIPTLAVGESATIRVDFVAEADALGTVDAGETVVVEAEVPNSAAVGAEAPLGDPGDPGDDITAEAGDSIDVRRDINLSIVKAFDPPEIEIPIQPQGTGQVLTIEVSNSGLSDADNVQVTDTVNGFLDVTGVTISPDVPANSCTVTPTTPDEPPLEAQLVECNVDIPAGETVVITVEYIVAPFLNNEMPIYGDPTSDGSEFRFVFDNGSILEGNALGPVYLDGDEITALGAAGLTKNDYLFDPDGPGGEDAFLLHLSCSDPFTGGWGQSGGPDEFLNPDWQIDYFSIARYKQGGQFFRNCGNVVGLFDVDNSATAAGVDWTPDDCPDGECDVVSDDAMLTVKEGIRLDHYQRKAKHASVDLTNFTGDPKIVRFLEVMWPTVNGSLRQITLDGVVIWQGDAAGAAGPPGTRTVTIGDLYDGDPVPADYDPTPWVADVTARTLEPFVTERLAFHFTEKSSGEAEYEIRLNFNEGTFLDIFIDKDTKGGGGKSSGPQSQGDAPPSGGSLPDGSGSDGSQSDGSDGATLPSAPPLETGGTLQTPTPTPEEGAEPQPSEPVGDLPLADGSGGDPSPAEPTPLEAEASPAVPVVDEARGSPAEDPVRPPSQGEPGRASGRSAAEPPIVTVGLADAASGQQRPAVPEQPKAETGTGEPSAVEAERPALRVESLTFQLEGERSRLTGTLALTQRGGASFEALEVAPAHQIFVRGEGGDWRALAAVCLSDRELVTTEVDGGPRRGTIHFACDLEAPVEAGAELQLQTEVALGDGDRPIRALAGGSR